MRLFIGIDPGSTAGIALIDASSETKYAETFSRKNISYSEILDYISNKGEPVVVATDKSKPPLLARKVAAAFGARLFYPSVDMKVSEKKDLARNFTVKNDHEADALAAALVAKSHFMDTLKKVERTVDPQMQGYVKRLLLTNQAGNIETAIEMLQVRRQQKIGKKRAKENDVFASRMTKELDDARARNASLEKELALLRSELEKKKYEKSESAAIEKLRQSSLKILKEKNMALREMEKIIEGACLLVCNYPCDEMRNKAVVLDNASDRAVREIEKSGAAAIVTDLAIRSALPIISKAKANIRPVGKFLVSDKIDASINERLSAKDFEMWLDAYKEKRKEEK